MKEKLKLEEGTITEGEGSYRLLEWHYQA